MTRVVIAKVWEIPPGDRKIVVPFRGRAGIGVFNVKGEFFALRNICPHKRGPLCTGELTGHIAAVAPPSGCRNAELSVTERRRSLALPVASVAL